MEDDRLTPMIGYGTFITSEIFRNKRNIEPCFIPHFRRIIPPAWDAYPFALPDPAYPGFFGLKFEVDALQLKELDLIEGVDSKLYYREKVEILIRGGKKTEAFIYIPTETTQNRFKITLTADLNDRWLEFIRQHHNLLREIPEVGWDHTDLTKFTR